MTSDPFPMIRPGMLLAEHSRACPDCRAGVRYLGALSGRPLLSVEHDDGCPMLAQIERDQAARRHACESESASLGGAR